MFLSFKISLFMRSLHDGHEVNAFRVSVSVRMIQLENSLTDLDEILYGRYPLGSAQNCTFQFQIIVIPTWRTNDLVMWD
jgi:hypothetical protein